MANDSDEALLGTYLPTSVTSVFHGHVGGPDDSFSPPPWLLHCVQTNAETPVPVPDPPPVKFATDAASVRHNTSLLEQSGFNMETLLQQAQSTTLGFGSEFRPLQQLQRLLGQHPNFPFFRTILEQGMDYIFTEGDELSNEQRAAELARMTTRGNHKSALDASEHVSRLLEKDVLHGFSLPVDPKIVPRINLAMVQPCGVVNQYGLMEDGSRVLKQRLTQDLSYSCDDDATAVNERIDISAYPDMIYGWCLSRIVHYVAALRLVFARDRILVAKFDFSDAYRRIAHSGDAAAQSILLVDDLAYIALRLTFGGAPNPPTWCAFAEMATDLSNETPLCADWDPVELRDPSLPLPPPPIILADAEPFAPAREMSVHVPTTMTGRSDCFVDDVIKVFLDTPENRQRQPASVPLAVHVTARPNAGPDTEPVPRRPNLSVEKLSAEGTPAETQIVLGWLLNTRAMLLRLPLDKHLAWSQDIAQILDAGTTLFGELESVIGRLNHVAFVIPLARHFLNQLRGRLKTRRPPKQRLTLSQAELADLSLWQTFLSTAHHGISLNLLTLRKPTRMTLSDACPFGLGGFTWSGTAWRLRVPNRSPLYGQSTANNFLEFLAMVITMWLCLLDCPDPSAECILATGDNTSALGWLYRTSRLPATSIHHSAANLLARKLATLVTDSGHCLYSQHLPGTHNVVTDLLSYTGPSRGHPHPLAPSLDFPDDLLTHRFHTFLPQLIPENFAISPLPSEISSFVSLAMRTAESSWIRSKKIPTKVATGHGADGTTSANAWTSTTASMTYPTTNAKLFSAVSSNATEYLSGIRQDEFLADVRNRWWRRQSELPQALWLRRCGSVSNSAPSTSREAKSSSPPSAPSSEP